MNTETEVLGDYLHIQSAILDLCRFRKTIPKELVLEFVDRSNALFAIEYHLASEYRKEFEASFKEATV